jgi:hypothetical protein
LEIPGASEADETAARDLRAFAFEHGDAVSPETFAEEEMGSSGQL